MPFLSIMVKDRSSHRSAIASSSTQWLLSAQPSNPRPLSFYTFLSHLLRFLNSNIACKHENSLAVFGAFSGKRSALFPSPSPFSELELSSILFYSSKEAGDHSTAEVVQPNSNSYGVFKMVDQSLVQRISREFDISANRTLKVRLAPYITASVWLTKTGFMPSEPCVSVGPSPRRYAVRLIHTIISFNPTQEPAYQPSRASCSVPQFP